MSHCTSTVAKLSTFICIHWEKNRDSSIPNIWCCRVQQPPTSALGCQKICHSIKIRPWPPFSLYRFCADFCGQLSGLQNLYHANLSAHPTSSIRHPFRTSLPSIPHLTSHSLHPLLISKHESTWQRGTHARLSSRQQDMSSSHGRQRLCCVSALTEYAGTLATVAVAASVGALILINREGLSAGLKLNQVKWCLFVLCAHVPKKWTNCMENDTEWTELVVFIFHPNWVTSTQKKLSF